MSIKGDSAPVAHHKWLMHYEGDDRAFQDVIWIICEIAVNLFLLNHLNELDFQIPNRPTKQIYEIFQIKNTEKRVNKENILYIINFLSYKIYFYKKKHKWTTHAEIILTLDPTDL